MSGIPRNRISSGSDESDAAPDKSFQDIAYEYDEFLTECAPINDRIDLPCVSKKDLIQDLLLKMKEEMYKQSDRSLDHLEDKLHFLDEMFGFHKQSHAAQNLNKLDEVALLEESKMLDLAIKTLSEVLNEDTEEADNFDIKKIVDDFTNCKNILNDTISTVFKEHSKEVTLLLSELLKNEFVDNQEKYFDLGSEQFPDNIVESLTEMGVIEYHPEDDTKIRLAI